MLSSMASASIRFSRPFSISSSFSFRASVVTASPYFAFNSSESYRAQPVLATDVYCRHDPLLIGKDRDYLLFSMFVSGWTDSPFNRG